MAKKNEILLDRELLLSRDEIQALMDVLGAKQLLGVLTEEKGWRVSKEAQAKAMETLQKRGIIQATGKSPAVMPHFAPLLSSLFNPEHALVVYRRLADQGRQIVYFLRKGDTIVMHSFPKVREHRVEIIPDLDTVMRFLQESFPMQRYPETGAHFQIPQDSFQQFEKFANAGDTQSAQRMIADVGISMEEKKNLISAISGNVISGSVSWMAIHQGTVKDVGVLLLMADKTTGWVISLSDQAPSTNPMLEIRRAGESAIGDMRAYAGHLMDGTSSGKSNPTNLPYTRFSLSLSELVLSLIAINCRDFGQQLMRSAEPGITAEEFEKCMQASQESLAKRNLFTVSPRGNPIPIPQLEQAVLPIARSDAMIQAVADRAGIPAECGIYIIKGRSFTAYYHLDSELQVLEHGAFKDLPEFIQRMFPELDRANAQPIPHDPITLSVETLNKLVESPETRQDGLRLLVAEGVPQTIASLIAVDLEDIRMRAYLQYRDAGLTSPAPAQPPETVQAALFIQQSAQRTWMFLFHSLTQKGIAQVTDRKGFQDAVISLINGNRRTG